eukprot:587026-Lingulodinium_polyedra.AAC.1
MMVELQAVAFHHVPEAVLTKVRTMFCCCTTKPVEDGFQRLRTVEARAQASQAVQPARAWHTLVQRQVLSKVHSFPELDYQECSLKDRVERLPKKVEKSTFRPAVTKPVLSLRD